MIPYIILGGYLGAGKTTLLNRLLENNAGQKLALLINDFGAINIDASLIEHQADDQINLTNGCVCCGLSDGFDQAIESLLSRQPPPDRIIVEASGVADVISLAQYGHHPGLVLDGVIVVADAETVRAKARDKYVAATVTRQLQGADLIILNKTDLVGPDQLAAITRWLETLAPGTPLVATSHCDVPEELLLGLEHRARSSGDGRAHESYTTWSLQHAAPLSETAIEAFVEALPESVLRAKGYFNASGARDDGGETHQRMLFQQVGARRTLQPSETAGPTELVVIGLTVELDLNTLDRLAGILTASAESVNQA